MVLPAVLEGRQTPPCFKVILCILNMCRVGILSVWYFTLGNSLAIYQQILPLIVQERGHKFEKQRNMYFLTVVWTY
jgi:hypothetical protein